MFVFYIYTHLFDQHFAFCNGPLWQLFSDHQGPSNCLYYHFSLASDVVVG